jgi:hypothetical protein
MSPEDRIKEQVDAIFQSIRDAQTTMAEDLAEAGLICGSLNPNLVARQKLTQDDINRVNALHEVKNQLFDEMAKLEPGSDRLSVCVAELEEIEFAMQRAWKFPEDEKFHTWWMLAPHCICPRMDNRDMTFYGRGRIMQQNCPLHGWPE